jgi:hypothetical protein
MTIRVFWPLALLALMACGGGSTIATTRDDPNPQPPIDPYLLNAVVVLKGLPENVVAAVLPVYDATNDTLTITGRVTDTTTLLSRVGVPPNDGAFLEELAARLHPFSVFAGNDAWALRIEAQSGGTAAGRATVAVWEGQGIQGAYERIGTTRLPTGSATFTGDYAGLVQNSDSESLANWIRGDASLVADFERATIAGSITRRRTNSSTFPDVVLTPTDIRTKAVPATGSGPAIPGGSFAGTVEQGANPPVGPAALEFARTSGSYEGLFVAERGNQAVGIVMIDHEGGRQRSSDLVRVLPDLRETGAFAVRLDPTATPAP